MNARSQMRHRATIQRDGASGENNWGGDNEPVFATHLRDHPCHGWFASESVIVDGNKVAVIERRKLMMPLSTDVTTFDRVLSVTDRQGREVFAGPMSILSVGRRADHLVLELGEVK